MQPPRRRCPDAARNDSGCHGGAEHPCKPSLARGAAWEDSPFCLLCNGSAVAAERSGDEEDEEEATAAVASYYDEDRSECAPCAGRESTTGALWLAALAGAALVAGAAVALLRRSSRVEHAMRRYLNPCLLYTSPSPRDS